MRSERIATWTSAEPVSPSERALSAMTSCLRSAVIYIGYLHAGVPRLSGEIENAVGFKPTGPQLTESDERPALKG